LFIQALQSPILALEKALGGGGIAELQQRMNKTKNELKGLRKDLGATPEAEALDSYIQIFELLGNLAPKAGKTAAKPVPPRPQPKSLPKPQQPQPNDD
jgi:hypothetical protein